MTCSQNDLDANRSRTHMVYELYDGNGAVLYVGCSSRLKRRLDTHRREREWWPRVSFVLLTPTTSFEAGRALERERIDVLRPPHNLLLNRSSEWDRGGHVGRAQQMAERHAAGEMCLDYFCKRPECHYYVARRSA